MPLALVLSAGGMFGAWEVGVWKVLREHIQPDLIVGVSAGALNGWCIAGGCTAEELAEKWLDPLTGRIFRFGLHSRGLVRPGPLYEQAHRMFERYQPCVPFGLTLSELPRLRARLVCGPAITWRHLAATCSVPLCFPPVEIDGRSYLDGGLLGVLPLWAAEEMGATRAIAVNALTTWPFRMLRKVVRPRRASPGLEVVRIEPSVRLGSVRDAVHWSRPNIERWIAQGEHDAELALPSI